MGVFIPKPNATVWYYACPVACALLGMQIAFAALGLAAVGTLVALC